MNLVLFEPEIPPNTGNIIRLCANTGTKLHLIKPLGFELDDKRMRRAGLDYAEFSDITIYESWQDFEGSLSQHSRIFALTTKGSRNFFSLSFQKNDYFIFGPETRGLPDSILSKFDAQERIRIPMKTESRSLNLSNSAAIVVYEALRQTGFEELE